MHVHAIINVGDQKDLPPDGYPPPLDILWFCLGNKSDPQMHLLVDAVEQAARWLQEGRVLYVHDIAGRNRLGFFVIALLMRLYHLPYEEARKLAKQKRPKLAPRKQFVKRLREYEAFLSATPR